MHPTLIRIRDLALPGNWEIAGYVGDPMRAHEIVANTPPAFVFEGPVGTYYADPILYRHHGRCALLFEEYVHSDRMARLFAQEIDERGGKIGEPQQIVREDWYMSFPYVAEVNGVLYLIPETSQKGSITAYPCRKFPFDWDPHIMLFEGMNGADTTLHVDGDTVYLLTSEKGGGGPDNRGALSVYWCEAAGFPNAPWSPVPVGSGVRGRNAGALFHSGNSLIRPSQISIYSYGEKMSLRAVRRIGRDGYDEQEIGLIEPIGSTMSHYHTLSSMGDLFVIDRKRIGLRPAIKAHIGRLQRMVANARGRRGYSCE
jgi:hypothetical protein